MEVRSLEDLYLAELQQLSNAEVQAADLLPRLVETTARSDLRRVLLWAFEKTEVHRQRLDLVLRQHGVDAASLNNPAMRALVTDAEKMIGLQSARRVRDAGLIVSLQKLMHYEVAAFGTTAAIAGQLNLVDEEMLLHECLEEVKGSDRLLSDLAKRKINPDAEAA